MDHGSVYDVQYPRLMETIELTDKNRAFVDGTLGSHTPHPVLRVPVRKPACS